MISALLVWSPTEAIASENNDVLGGPEPAALSKRRESTAESQQYSEH